MNIGIDLDGTIYRSNTLIPRAREAIMKIKNKHEIFYLTNNASTTPNNIRLKLEKLLKTDISVNNLITPIVVSQTYLFNNRKKFYLYSNKEIKSYFNNLNLSIVDNLNLADIALIGRSSKYGKDIFNQFSNFHNNGGEIFAFNKDMTYPTDTGFELGNGALINDLENHIGIKILSFGKPDQYFVNYIKKLNINLDYVVGDRLDTDIQLGLLLNSHAILVETGVHNSSDKLPKVPTFNVHKDLYSFSKSI